MTPAITPKRPASWRDLVLILALSFRTAPIRATLVIVLTMLSRASDTLFAWIFKIIIDGAIAGDGGAIVWGAVATGGIMGFALLSGLGGLLHQVGAGRTGGPTGRSRHPRSDRIPARYRTSGAGGFPGRDDAVTRSS
ncbi:MAG: hypothetical protein ACLGH3_06300 [Actinomycetota bacterium]